MNGKLNMRRIIKESPELKTSNLDESIVSEETVNSGNYNNAQKLLQKCSATGDVLAEQFYRLGNRFFNENQIQAAELAWTKACLLYTSPSPRDLSTSRMPSSA